MTDPSIATRLDALYHRGATTIYAARIDQRFSYTLYVPTGPKFDPGSAVVLVSIHGTGRMQSLYRDLFAEFAEQHNCIILAPLFPANVLQDGNLSGYKYIAEGPIRYDLVILDMIDEVATRYGIDGRRVLMFGFSGGGHFTHRFTLLYPHRIRAASIGAPGSVTCLDDTKPWWVGTADTEAKFGIRIDVAAFRSLPLHFVVGEDDTETWEITFNPGDRHWMEGANSAGATRPERIATLAESFSRAGAKTKIDRVPGAAHDVVAVADKTRQFFSAVLARGDIPS